MVDGVNPAAIIPASRSDSGGRQGQGWARRRFLSASQANRTVDDVATVLGGSESGLSLAVEQSMAALVDEIERLRHEIELARHYENFLGEEADRHPTLPVLNRRALLRELGQLLVASEEAGLPGSLLYLHIGGVERLRALHGISASDAALFQAAQTIRAECRQTDLVGYLDGGDFAIALALAEPAAAEEKVKTLIAHLAEQPVIWEGNSFLFTVGFGLAHFQEGLSAEGALAAADAAWRDVSPPPATDEHLSR
jgi:GGDEF domain-containing protein